LKLKEGKEVTFINKRNAILLRLEKFLDKEMKKQEKQTPYKI